MYSFMIDDDVNEYLYGYLLTCDVIFVYQITYKIELIEEVRIV